VNDGKAALIDQFPDLTRLISDRFVFNMAYLIAFTLFNCPTQRPHRASGFFEGGPSKVLEMKTKEVIFQKLIFSEKNAFLLDFSE